MFRMSSSAFYVYCIAETAAVAQLPAESLPTAIEEDAVLEWVQVNKLAALVSEVPQETYSEDSLAEHLTDATWTAIRAMRHETLVEYVAKRASVIPLRFGTIYLERAGIEQMLTEARVILPGAQALLGFQFIVILTEAFGELPDDARLTHFIALCSVAFAIVLLITPAAIHRLTFDGADRRRFHTIGSWLVTAALVPLAIGIACDLFVAATKMLADQTLALTLASAAFILLMGLWYVLPLVLARLMAPRRRTPHPNIAH